MKLDTSERDSIGSLCPESWALALPLQFCEPKPCCPSLSRSESWVKQLLKCQYFPVARFSAEDLTDDVYTLHGLRKILILRQETGAVGSGSVSN